MSQPNPATPPKGATPGSGEQNNNTPPGAAPTSTGGQGNNNQGGTVTITTEEYARLQRSDARSRSFDKRVYRKPSSQPANIDPNDPNAGALATERAAREEAERRAMQLEVKGKVRDLIADERFKGIPQSTKKLILDAPHMFSEAETLDEAMYDIEDKLIELAQSEPANNTTPPANGVTPPANNQPNRETPPVVTPGNPAPVDAGVLEDTSKLRGTERSTATLRNTFKKAGFGTGPQR